MRFLACLCFATILSAVDTIDAAFAVSLRAEKSGDYAAARAALTPYERRLSGDYLYQVRVGWLALCAGDYQTALISYRSAQHICPSSLEPRLGQVRAYLVAQTWGEAESAARQVLQIDPLNYTANFLLVTALRGEGRSDAARRQLDTVLERYPSDTTLLALAVATANESGRSDDARTLSATLTRLGQDAAK